MEEMRAKRKGCLSEKNWGPKKARCSALTLAMNWERKKVHLQQRYQSTQQGTVMERIASSQTYEVLNKFSPGLVALFMIFAGIVYGAESIGTMKHNEKDITSLREQLKAKDKAFEKMLAETTDAVEKVLAEKEQVMFEKTDAIEKVLAEKEKVMVAKTEAIEKVAAAEKRELESKIESLKNDKRRGWL